MFQLFLRARARSYFKARSSARDHETDYVRISNIFRAVEQALEGARAEQAGLTARINDVVARSSVTLGNDSDEYITREPQDQHLQNLLGVEIANGQRRLKELGPSILHFQFLKAALSTRFPDFKSQDKI